MPAFKLFRYITPENVLIAPPVGNRDELLEAFAGLLVRRGLARTPDEAVESLARREAILSTGIGGGVAAPHAQLDGLGGIMIAASTHPDGLDYPTLDGKPVRVTFCLLAGAGVRTQHLAALARIARLARRGGAVEHLAAARDGEDFVVRLERLEGGL